MGFLYLVYCILLFCYFPLVCSWEIVGEEEEEIQLGSWVSLILIVVYCSALFSSVWLLDNCWNRNRNQFGFLGFLCIDNYVLLSSFVLCLVAGNLWGKKRTKIGSLGFLNVNNYVLVSSFFLCCIEIVGNRKEKELGFWVSSICINYKLFLLFFFFFFFLFDCLELVGK